MTELTQEQLGDDERAMIRAARLAVGGLAGTVVHLGLAAALRVLADQMIEGGWEDGSEWPEPDDLKSMADDIEACGGELPV